MPHYRDGTPAKHGDLVIHTDAHGFGTEKVGVVTEVTPGSDSCNAQVLLLAKRQKGYPMPGSQFQPRAPGASHSRSVRKSAATASW